MSGFVAATSGVQMIGRQDLRLNRADFQPRGAIFIDLGPTAPSSFVTEWWPKGGGLIGDLGLDVGILGAKWWGYYDQAAGASSNFGVTGVTRDAYGSALGGCTVKLFLTATDALVATVVSDVNTGEFTLPTVYYPNTHYLVTYKTGSPDVFGSSPNTLIAT